MSPTPAPVPGTVGQIGSDFLMAPRKNTTVSTKGLLNMPGQNNCFLNSAVQVLWHLDAFRRNFRDLSEHSCMAESCIFCALKELFTQFQYSHESALPPDALRHALAKTFCDQRRFQLGFMDDAAECFENILLRIHVHIANQESEDMCGNVHCIPHQKFAMTLVEQRICHNCAAASEPMPFTQMVHYVTTSALCAKAVEIQKLDPNSSVANSFGKLLRLAGEMGEVRECSGGCGEKVQAKKTLMNHPDVVSVGLVWDSECPTLQHITDVFHSIGMYLQLQEMFHNVYDTEWSNTTIYQLVGVVTYYGKHYSTFFFHTKLRVWIYFDDATVQEIGPSWEQVVEKCQRGRFQPLLLLYANPNGSSNIPNRDYYSQKCDSKNKPSLGNQRQAVINQYLKLQNSQKMANLKSYVDVKNSDYYSNYVNDSYLYNSHRMSDHGPIPHSPGYVVNSAAFFNQESPTWKNQTPQALPVYSNLQYLNSLPKNHDHSVNDVALAPVPQMPLLDVRALSSTADFQQPYVGVNGYEYQLQSKKADFDASKDSDSAFTEEDPEVSDMYISRKAVENVLKQQKRHMSLCRSYSQTSVGNRNSSSSLESFDTGQCNSKVSTAKNLPTEGVPNQGDPGSWCGDRNSSSSNTSVENPFLAVVTSKRLLLGLNKKSSIPDSNTSDHGYDSFSVSSSDSYPSVNGSPIKIEPRLTQIPEDWQPEDTDLEHKLKLITEDTQGPPDCDKLCAEADLLLAKSHEKEKDGDLVMAALLSDSAAARARAAMEAPYNNSRSLVSAKLKHSTCVMRSSNLYRRIKDHEVDERRKQKAHTGHHSRQSSRDSTHSKHSRQGSKDSTHAKTTESNPNSDEAEPFGKNIEIYGTLPKKGSRKKNVSTGSLKVKDDQIYKDFLDKQRKNTNLSVSLSETSQKNVDPPKKRDDFSPKRKIQANGEKTKSETPKSPTRKKDSPPKPEVESKKRSQKQQATPTKSNVDDKRNGVEFSCRDLLSPIPTNDKKPHKIKRKLMGGFMKRKNRSLPDLREDQASNDPMDCFLDDAIIQVPSVILPNGKTKKIEDPSLGNVTRGFHQPHHAFVKKDLTQRPLLVKVNPPSIQTAVLNNKPKLVHTLPALPSKFPEMNNKIESTPSKPSKIPFMSNLPKSESNLPPIPPVRTSETKLTTRSGLPPKISAIPVLTPQVSLSPIKPSNLQREDSEASPVPEHSSDDLPPPTNPFLAELQAKRKQLLDKSTQKQETPESKKMELPFGGMKEFSMLPKLALHGSGTSWLKELQSKQQMLLNKQDVELSKPVIAQEKPGISNELRVSKNAASMGINKAKTINWKLPSENSSEVVSSPSVVPQAAGKNSNSVKNLASRFEKVLLLPKEGAAMSTLPPSSSEEQTTLQANSASLANSTVAPENNPPKNSHVKFNLTPETFPPPPPACASINMPLKSALKTRNEYNRESTQSQPTTSPKTAIGHPESSTKIIKSALKQSLPPSPTTLQAPALPSSPRPMQPPDYATAMQRLEIIRTGDNIAKEVTPDVSKKAKKTVTFSDEVVLVACAEYDEIDFSSNPLFERVYQQHVESGKGEISILSSAYNNCHSLDNSNICDTVQGNQMDETPSSALTCNLCRNKSVIAPNSYCTDCEFYLSRFQP